MIIKVLRMSMLAAAFGMVMGGAFATPISIVSTLTGDGRPTNPDNLIVDVTITGDTTSNVVSFKFDINSPLHPNAKLDEFYFNVLGNAADFSFSGFSPTDWDVSSPASVQGGGGGFSFLFEALDPVGPPNAADVTNSVDLLFTMTKSTGNFTAADFLSAASTCSTDTALGCGQLGTHLQSLTVAQGSGLSDSGFALGNYSSSTSSTSSTSGQTSGNIPEPSSSGLVFLGLGLVAASFWTRRRGTKAAVTPAA